MIGVPLGIVDKEKIIELVKALFNAHDAEATFELEVGSPTTNGNRRVHIEITCLTSGLFANGLLRGYNPGGYNAAPDTVPQGFAHKVTLWSDFVVKNQC